jgi:hypothetical protein
MTLTTVIRKLRSESTFIWRDGLRILKSYLKYLLICINMRLFLGQFYMLQRALEKKHTSSNHIISQNLYMSVSNIVSCVSSLVNLCKIRTL